MRPFDQVGGEKQSVSDATGWSTGAFAVYTHFRRRSSHYYRMLSDVSSTAPLCPPPVCSAADAVDSDVSAALIRISRRRRWRVTAQKRLLSALVKAECSALVLLETDYCPSLCRGLVGSEPYRCHLMLAYQASAVCPLAKRWNVCCSI